MTWTILIYMISGTIIAEWATYRRRVHHIGTSFGAYLLIWALWPLFIGGTIVLTLYLVYKGRI